MDKNTVWGLVLMAAIFFGFMYCNKPTPQENTPQQTTAAAASSAAAAQSSGAQFLSPSQLGHLRQAVASLGTDSVYTDPALNLRLTADGVTGSVAVDSTSVAIEALSDSASTLDPDLRLKAIASVEALINRSAKYGAFAPCLSGDNTPVVLENDLVKITLNSRGAMVALSLIHI